MKLLTIDDGDSGRLGLLVNDEVFDARLTASLLGGKASVPDSVSEYITGGEQTRDATATLVAEIGHADEAARGSLRERSALTSFGDTKLLAPIPEPAFILSVGMNYRDHLAEMNTPVPDVPASFTKHPGSVTGSGKAIHLPTANSDMVDYEGEICFVFGRECYNVTEQDAWDYVAGLTIANDVSARDWVAPIFQQETSMGAIHAWEVNVLGKQYPTFCPMGPVLATLDEIADLANIRIETRLNGEVVQSSSSSQFVFDIPKLIAYFSQWYRFAPGDIVTTGSPAGVGYGREPKLFMRDGDIVEVELEGVGVLSNPVSRAPQ
ncbi:MAG: fumarylacetoacetate hydrolase family protein [Candidatus Rariloculaceae bacterium]